MNGTVVKVAALVVAMIFAIAGNQAAAQSSVEQNSNAVGVTPESNHRGIPAMQDSASLNAANPDKDPLFRASWMDARNVRGQIHTEEFDGQLPYTSNGPATLSRRPGKLPTLEEDEFETLMAESVEDFIPVAEFGAPVPDPGTGASNVGRSTLAA